MCIGHFFDRVIRISARVFAFLNLAIIIVGLVCFFPANWSKAEVFREIVKSKGINEAVYFILQINDNADTFFCVLLSLILVSSILLFFLRWKTKARINIWFLLLINIHSICNCMLSVIDGRENGNLLRRSLESSDIDIEKSVRFINIDFYAISFLIYLVLLLFNAVFLWRMSEKRPERGTN